MTAAAFPVKRCVACRSANQRQCYQLPAFDVKADQETRAIISSDHSPAHPQILRLQAVANAGKRMG